MSTDIQDRRLLQSNATRELIKDTFLTLLQTIPFSKLRVTAICSHAHITRTTFYYHYCDIFKLVDDILADLLAILSNTTMPLAEQLHRLQAIVHTNDATLLKQNSELLPPCHRLIHETKYHSLLKEPALSPYIIDTIYRAQKDAFTEVLCTYSTLDAKKAQLLFWHIVNGSFAINQKLCWTASDEYYEMQLILLRFILGGYHAVITVPET